MAMAKNEKISKVLKKAEINLADLADSRIITKNLVYVIGLSSRIASKDTLTKKEYFGQYGSIIKIVVNNNKAYNQNNPKGPSFSAYVTYARPYEASIAILSLDNILVDDHLIRASFGTTKIECNNKDCLFLHKVADPNDIISRENLNGNKNIFLEQQLYAMRIADVYSTDVKKKLLLNTGIVSINIKKLKNIFPAPENIYNKPIVKENDPIYLQKNKIAKKNYYEDNNTFNSNTLTSNGNTLTVKNLSLNAKYENNTYALIDKEAKESKENISNNTNCSNNKLNNVLQRQKLEFSLISMISADTTSTSSKEDFIYQNSCNEDKQNDLIFTHANINLHINSHKLFQIREDSRFKFVLDNKENIDKNDKTVGGKNDIIEVPNFIQSILSKKSATFILSRNMKHLEDVMYSDKKLEAEFKNNNHWAQFILENKCEIDTKYYDKELIDDFDYINNLILNKRHTNINKK